MTVHLADINYLAVLVAAVVSFAVGGLWFSPLLFGRAWMTELNFRREDLQQRKGMGWMYARSFAYSAITALVLALFLEVTNAAGAVAGVKLGALAAGGFVATSLATNYLFEGRSFRLFLVNAGHHVAAFVAMGAVLGAWR
jgi:sterol desaturase/sphingolipid hydroxylase (fatty acid hydroxylase superfamily)